LVVFAIARAKIGERRLRMTYSQRGVTTFATLFPHGSPRTHSLGGETRRMRTLSSSELTLSNAFSFSQPSPSSMPPQKSIAADNLRLSPSRPCEDESDGTSPRKVSVQCQAASREFEPSVSCPRMDQWIGFPLLPDFLLISDCEGRDVVKTRLRPPQSRQCRFICNSYSPELSGIPRRIPAARAQITRRSAQIQNAHQTAAHTISLSRGQNRLHDRGKRCPPLPIRGKYPFIHVSETWISFMNLFPRPSTFFW
jgi:hypothetical protein